MAVTEKELNDALSRAALLMSKDGQRKIEQAKKMNENRFDSNGEFIKPAESNSMRNLSTNQYKSSNVTNSKLPKAILESMTKHVIDDSMSEYSAGTSVLDNLENLNRKQEQTTAVYEQYNTNPYQPSYTQMPQQQYIPQPMLSIDYNYIRTIVNECVKENLKAIKDEILNESSLKAIRLGGENKIQLIDNKNNLYESKLEFKKNISKK